MTTQQALPVWVEAAPEVEETPITFADEKTWLREVRGAFNRWQAAEWEFLLILRCGVDQFAKTDPARTAIYKKVGDELHRSPKTVQNWVSASRKPSTKTAIELELSMSHAVAVLGLLDEHAVDVLTTAAEQGLSAEATAWLAHGKREEFAEQYPAASPGAGNSYEPQSYPDEPAYASNYMYREPGEPVTCCPNCGHRLV